MVLLKYSRRPDAMTDAHIFRSAADTFPIDAAVLARYLDRVGLPIDPDVPIQQFATGLANINYRLRVAGRDVVLRRPPDGDLPPGAHDMKREHHVLSHLAKVFPLAPDSLHLCEDKSVIGVPFQIIEYRAGRVIKGDDASWTEGDPSRAADVGEMLVDTMVALHQVEPESCGLGEFGRPEGFIARAIKGWSGRAVRLEPEASLARMIDETSVWLATQPIRDRAPTLLHCDFKLDNMILDPETLAPRAIVDWDMGTRGDPLFDLATMISYWTEAGDPDCMHRMAQMPTAAPGFQTRDEIVQLYAGKTSMDVSDYPVIRVLCVFKLATVFLQLYALYQREPEARPGYASFDRLAAELYEFAFEIMKGRATA